MEIYLLILLHKEKYVFKFLHYLPNCVISDDLCPILLHDAYQVFHLPIYILTLPRKSIFLLDKSGVARRGHWNSRWNGKLNCFFKVCVVLTEFNNFLHYYKYISVIFADYSALIHLFMPWSNIVHALPRPSAVFLQSCRAVITWLGPPAALLLLCSEGVLRLIQVFKTCVSISDLNKISIAIYFDLVGCIQTNSDLNQTWSVGLYTLQEMER